MSAADIDMMLSCANCGKGEEESDNLKKCSACLLVKYCSAECQKAHRPQHKKICKRRAAELYDEKLFKEIEPEECPICMLPLPLDASQTVFNSCCGKLICKGCIYAMQISGGQDLCAFCRTPPPSSSEEIIQRIKKLMDKKNAKAFHHLAGCYSDGTHDLPQDYQKAKELWVQAGELGCAEAYLFLAFWVQEMGGGGAIDKKKVKHYYELAAMGGCMPARHNLARLEGQAGNHSRGMKHLIMAARAGSKESLDEVKRGYKAGLVTKDEYANALRAHHERQKEMKSDARDKAKIIGDE